MLKEGVQAVSRSQIDDFLKKSNVQHTPRILECGGQNGDGYINEWIGSPIKIDNGEINVDKIKNSNGTGCLISTRDNVRIVLFIKNGSIVRAADSRQIGMNLEL